MICPICRATLIKSHTHRLNGSDYEVYYRIYDDGIMKTVVKKGIGYLKRVVLQLDGLVYLDVERIEKLLLLKE